MKVPVLFHLNHFNQNGRIYPKEILYKAMDEINSMDHPLYGQIGHGENLIDLSKVSHKISNASVDNNVLSVDIETLENTQGKILENIFNYVVFRPRSLGTVNDDGIVNVDTYKLITFDAIPESSDSFKNIL